MSQTVRGLSGHHLARELRELSLGALQGVRQGSLQRVAGVQKVADSLSGLLSQELHVCSWLSWGLG